MKIRKTFRSEDGQSDKFTKKDLKAIREMLHDIETLSYHWHIYVSNDHRRIVQKAFKLVLRQTEKSK